MRPNARLHAAQFVWHENTNVLERHRWHVLQRTAYASVARNVLERIPTQRGRVDANKSSAHSDDAPIIDVSYTPMASWRIVPSSGRVYPHIDRAIRLGAAERADSRARGFMLHGGTCQPLRQPDSTVERLSRCRCRCLNAFGDFSGHVPKRLRLNLRSRGTAKSSFAVSTMRCCACTLDQLLNGRHLFVPGKHARSSWKKLKSIH